MAVYRHMIVSPRCISCGGQLKYMDDNVLIMVSCGFCGKVYQAGTEESEFSKWHIGTNILKDTKEYGKVWTMKEACEANKRAKNCVVCGEELTFHPSLRKTLYCKCIEDLRSE